MHFERFAFSKYFTMEKRAPKNCHTSPVAGGENV